MSDLFPYLFDGAALITGVTLFATGVKHTFNAMTLRTKVALKQRARLNALMCAKP